MRAFVYVAVSAIFLSGSNLYADDSLLEDKSKELQIVQDSLSKNLQVQKSTQENYAKIHHELQHLERRLRVQKINFHKISKKIEKLQEELKKNELHFQESRAILKKNEKKYSEILGMLVRVRLMHMHPVLLYPGRFDDYLKSQMVLSGMINFFHEDILSVMIFLQNIEEEEKNLHDQYFLFSEKKKKLRAVASSIENMLSEKKVLENKLKAEEELLKIKVHDLFQRSVALSKILEPLQGSKDGTHSIESQDSISQGSLSDSFDFRRQLLFPVKGRIELPYGANSSVDLSETCGIVIAVEKDVPVVAPYQGSVVFAQEVIGQGLVVIIKHGGDYYSILSGLDTFMVSVGDQVRQGDGLGSVFGKKQRKLLYFELRKGQQSLNPFPWLSSGEGRDAF